MDDYVRSQIRNNLQTRETEDLLDIWQHGSVDEWEEDVFDIISEILRERLGEVPQPSVDRQVKRILNSVEENLRVGQLDQALKGCGAVIQLRPDLALAYNYRGEIYEEMDEWEKALTDYQTAIQLAPGFKEARQNLQNLEDDMVAEFEESETKQRLDHALDCFYDDETEKALAECELARPTLPSIAPAHNYLGLILEEMGQVEAAVESYRRAIHFNPRFYPARENLANATLRLDEDEYRQVANVAPPEMDLASMIPGATVTFGDDDDDIYWDWEGDAPVPQWVYMDEKSFILPGWPGHRNRQGRFGLDPLDSDFENAHIEGVVIRMTLTGHFRTHNPFFLLLMTFVGLVYSMPLLGIVDALMGNWPSIFITIVGGPALIFGQALLLNVLLSFFSNKEDGENDYGYSFF